MTAFFSRRLIHIGATLIAALLILWVHHIYALTLHHTAFLSGWLLFSGMIFLTLYNVRKKLPFLPLGSSQRWLQLHIYVGWLTIFLFILHIFPRLPNSLFEIILASLFVIVALSGVLGIFLSRHLSARLTTHGEEVLYERIPSLRKSIREKADLLAIRSVAEAETQTIAQFYIHSLQPFLHGPKNFFWHLIESNAPWSRLQEEMRNLERYLDARETKILAELREFARAKHNLDYHYTLQSCLKYWLFVHIPTTYALLIFAIVHIILVYAFI